MVWIVRIAAGIIVVIAHTDDSSRWKADGVFKAVNGLPILIPKRNADQLSAAAIWPRCPSFQPFTEIVRMGIDRQHLRIYWKFDAVADDKITATGRNI